MRTVRDFGAVGDGVADDTAAIQHAVDQHMSHVIFEPGVYRLTKSIVVDLAQTGFTSISGGGGTVKILMEGAGPAFDVRGSHTKSADPKVFEPGVWSHERMPLFQSIEIEGRHPEADGIHLFQTMQSTFESVLLRKLRHGIHITERARNLLVSHCHIFNNTGVGIFLDHCNLHQAIISGSHISFNKQSGIKILNGEIRNIQITGNDIEYNYDSAKDAPPSAEIWIETTGENATVREGTISSNTIQARQAPGGANIRFLSRPDAPLQAGLFTISGNLIGSQETNIDLVAARGVSITGNVIYSGHLRNLRAKDSRNINVTGNTFDHNADYLPKELATGITFENCTDCLFSGSIIHDAFAGGHTVSTYVDLQRKGLVEILGSKRITVSACQILDPGVSGIHVDSSSFVNIHGCTILDAREEPMMPHAVDWSGAGAWNQISGCTLGQGTGGPVNAAAESSLVVGDNLMLR